MSQEYPTGFCWKCGKPCKEGDLFCNPKHEQQYQRNQERQVKKSKRDGYVLAGSTH